ncbi:hypothetical protein H7K12_23225 [Mycobacterium senegalense]|uniref:hypothetical protein n=1 Tax=Mycolicibacterium TaxID=1866885 RepID=UPI00055F17D6|nr:MULTISPECIES: hypothetical protein [Mycolicibacterium]MCV7337917.1 hypothetical protein [Mycolicibacterium senegalense]MDR7291271.1 hypothetical protein [Mycolicibacterium senegalense]QZA22777.1 hypothetical protein K3U95_18830 [Mycolicibacterium senegalense]
MNWRRLRFVDRILYWLDWFGPFVYLGVGIYMCWLAIRWIPSTPMPDQLFTWLLLVIGLVCLRQSYKGFLEVRDAELLYPSSDQDPDDKPEWRHPLTPELREQLLSMFSLLKAAGIIGPDEVTDEEVVECAEHTDVFEDMDIHSVSMVLESLADEREPPLDHFTFFTDQAGPYDDDVFEIVGAFARISGYDGPLHQISCDMTGDYPDPYDVPDSAEQFYVSRVATDLQITYTTPAKIEKFNAAVGPEPTWVPIEHTSCSPGG